MKTVITWICGKCATRNHQTRERCWRCGKQFDRGLSDEVEG